MTFRKTERKLPDVWAASKGVEVVVGAKNDGQRVANIKPHYVTSSGIIRFEDSGKLKELIEDLTKALAWLEGIDGIVQQAQA